MKSLCFLLIAAVPSILAQNVIVLDVKGIDFQADHVDDLPRMANQIQIHDGLLYLRNDRDPKIYIATPEGQIVDTIGHGGQGPGEFNERINTFGVYQDRVFALSRKRQFKIFAFDQGNFSHDFEVSFYRFCAPAYAVQRMAVSDRFAILPAHPKSGHLAMAYDRDGQGHPFGKQLFDPKDGDMLATNPCINQVLWVTGEDSIFGVFKYLPIVEEYDLDLNFKRSFSLSNPRLTWLQQELEEKDPARFSIPPSLFSDCQILGNRLFLLASGTLFAIDIPTMAVAQVYAFRGVGEAFAGRENNDNINFFTFAVADNGRDLFLGPGNVFNGDLFLATLPAMPDPQAGSGGHQKR